MAYVNDLVVSENLVRELFNAIQKTPLGPNDYIT